MADYDIAIIGGGINGAALARDASGRGLKTLLLEQDDLASGTSSTSTKLIHGGLRYLEQGAFGMVREGLQERARLLRTAPHIIWPARFVLPHHRALRPAWLLRLGLFIYDALGGARLLPGAGHLHLHGSAEGAPLHPHFHRAFEYSDCCVDDARLVVLNAVDAAARGAHIRTRTRLEHAVRQGPLWQLTFSHAGQQGKAGARALINAAGPWVEGVAHVLPEKKSSMAVKLMKGSHIVVPRLFAHAKAYIFQNADGRIVFAIPYEEKFTLIGTTDIPFSGNPAEARAGEDEIAYLCALAGEYFRTPVTPSDVVWHFAGVRALADDRSLAAKDLSRDFVLEVDGGPDTPPLLTITGGKLTAARHLAEDALARLAPFLPMGHAWTGDAPLPGGDFAWQDFEAQVEKTRARWPFLAPAQARRLTRAYGTRAALVLQDARRAEDLGADFGYMFTQAELRYLMTEEWAQTPDDVLWRRTKMGLHLTPAQQQHLARAMDTEAAHG